MRTFDEWVAFYEERGSSHEDAKFAAALELGLTDGDVLARDDEDVRMLTFDELVAEFEACGYGPGDARDAAHRARGTAEPEVQIEDESRGHPRREL